MAQQPSRAATTRAATARPSISVDEDRQLEIDVSGLPADLEPTWIREECLGFYDANNVRRAQQRGYTPVKAEDLPGYVSLAAPPRPGEQAQVDPYVRTGGQILMARPKELAQRERARLAAQTEEAVRSVARDTAAPKDGVNFRDLDPEVSVRTDRSSRRFSE